MPINLAFRNTSYYYGMTAWCGDSLRGGEERKGERRVATAERTNLPIITEQEGDCSSQVEKMKQVDRMQPRATAGTGTAGVCYFQCDREVRESTLHYYRHGGQWDHTLDTGAAGISS